MSVPFRIGDIVTYVYGGNGTGEGILWRVISVNPPTKYGTQTIRIVAYYTLTGPSVRKKAHKVSSSRVTKLSAFDLGVLRIQLDDICREVLAHECGVEKVNVKA